MHLCVPGCALVTGGKAETVTPRPCLSCVSGQQTLHATLLPSLPSPDSPENTKGAPQQIAGRRRGARLQAAAPLDQVAQREVAADVQARLARAHAARARGGRHRSLPSRQVVRGRPGALAVPLSSPRRGLPARRAAARDRGRPPRQVGLRAGLPAGQAAQAQSGQAGRQQRAQRGEARRQDGQLLGRRRRRDGHRLPAPAQGVARGRRAAVRARRAAAWRPKVQSWQCGSRVE